jgi:hypothetical protein
MIQSTAIPLLTELTCVLDARKIVKHVKIQHCWLLSHAVNILGKGKGLPQQAEAAQGVPGRLRLRIFSTFSTMRVVGRQPYAPAAFTPGEIPGTHF